MKSNRADRNNRSSRRGGFNDDFMSSSFYYENQLSSNREKSFNQPVVASSGPSVNATVKWFNSGKGFGFAELLDGSGDAFLHINSLIPLGHKSVNPGTTLLVKVGDGPKGRQITEILSVDLSTAEASSDFEFNSSRPGKNSNNRHNRAPRPPLDDSQASEVTGTVKWYNNVKGFGFITPNDGGKDIFVHVSALEHSGLSELNEGQVTKVRVVNGQKGPEAASLSLI